MWTTSFRVQLQGLAPDVAARVRGDLQLLLDQRKFACSTRSATPEVATQEGFDLPVDAIVTCMDTGPVFGDQPDLTYAVSTDALQVRFFRIGSVAEPSGNVELRSALCAQFRPSPGLERVLCTDGNGNACCR